MTKRSRLRWYAQRTEDYKKNGRFSFTERIITLSGCRNREKHRRRFLDFVKFDLNEKCLKWGVESRIATDGIACRRVVKGNGDTDSKQTRRRKT